MMYEPARRGVRRVWIPFTAAIAAVAAVAGLWNYPNPDFPNDDRSLYSSISVMLAILIAAFWLMFLSGLRWVFRIGILAAAVALVFGTMRWPDFQGNLIPSFRFRWQHRERGSLGSADQVAIPAATDADFPEDRNRN